MSKRSIAYIWLVVITGAAVLAHGLWIWTSADTGKYIAYLILALAATAVKIELPSVDCTISLSFLFMLIGVSEFSLGESLLLAGSSVIAQRILLAKKRPFGIQMAFNIASTALSIQVAYAAQHAPLLHNGLITATVFFLANSIPVAIVIALTEDRNAWQVWRDSYFWTFPNFLVGAAGTWLVGEAGRRVGWQAGLLVMPIAFVIYRSHRSYIARLEEAQKRAEQEAAHSKEVAGLHRRTIEMLALAIEAKDQTTHDHLQRVETYAIEVGKELGLSQVELEALRAAALLHDIGKLAVPEYIIAKPGKLTPAEFEKMKIHTVVGADIVERIGFPYAVAPIVRGHHERWDGQGYPDGLAGERIPIGARILSAVDCLDALASDRQYRRALPLNTAMGIVKAEAGKQFDPAVVAVLAHRYIELEALAKSEIRIARLPVDVRVCRGDAPAAGFEKIAGAASALASRNAASSETPSTEDLAALQTALVLANSQAKALAGLIGRVAELRTPEAAYHELRVSLPEIVPYDVLVVYRRQGDLLAPDWVCGDDSGLFESQEIPVGEGLTGWVAEHGRAIINGNPDVEPGYLTNPARFSNLRAALAVPLVATGGIAGVLSLYRSERDVFTNANLASLTALSTSLAAAIESPRLPATFSALLPVPA